MRNFADEVRNLISDNEENVNDKESKIAPGKH